MSQDPICIFKRAQRLLGKDGWQGGSGGEVREGPLQLSGRHGSLG